MKNVFVAALALTALVFSACSDDSVQPGDGNGRIQMQTRLDNSASVRLMEKSGGGTSTILAKGETVDSLRVSQVRLLISRIKLHRSNQDTISGDREVKLAPVALIFDSAGVRTVMNELIPAGSYDKVKFEFHKISSSEESQYRNDTTFGEFVNGGRYTAVISGTVYKNGVASAFRYTSDVTANLTLDLDQTLAVGEGVTQTVILSLLPAQIFKEGASVLDPRDKDNESHIDNMIKAALKALKK